MFAFVVLHSSFSTESKRLAEKNVSEMAWFASNGTY